MLVDGRDAGTLWAPGASTAADAAGVVRRWREVELPLPSEVVAGRRSLRVTLRPDPPPLGGAPRLTVYGLQLWAVTGPGLSAR